MPEAKTPTSIDEVMEAAWNESIGEELQELPDENQHLAAEVEPEEAPAAAVEDDSTPKVEEPEETAEVPEQVAEKATPEEETGPPKHWSEEDRATFNALDKPGQEFLLRRHKQMEADYTRKTQANADAVRLGSVISQTIDPDIQRQLEANNVSHDDFVRNLVQYHRLSMTDPVSFVRQTMQNLKLSPEQVFGKPSEQSESARETADDPITSRIVNLETRLNQDTEARQRELQGKIKTTISEFESEKTETGEPAHPHFAKVRQNMAKLMMADSTLELKDAYEVAVFRDPELRSSIMPKPSVATPAVAVDKEKLREGELAAKAAKSNLRGSGRPGMPSKAQANGPVNLRSAIEEAANEVGMT